MLRGVISDRLRRPIGQRVHFEFTPDKIHLEWVDALARLTLISLLPRAPSRERFERAI
jgi:hypothetical protein